MRRRHVGNENENENDNDSANANADEDDVGGMLREDCKAPASCHSKDKASDGTVRKCVVLMFQHNVLGFSGFPNGQTTGI